MRKEVNIFIFLLGLLTFNWPLMKIFDFSLPIYMFLCCQQIEMSGYRAHKLSGSQLFDIKQLSYSF